MSFGIVRDGLMEGGLRRGFVLAILSVALVAPVIGGAKAQGLHPGFNQGMAADLLPPHEVTTVIASMGMRPLSRPIWRGDRYVVFAVDRYGQEVRVVLDARNGQVLAVRPSMRGAEQGGYPPEAGGPSYGYEHGNPPPPGYSPSRQAPYDPRYGTPSPPPGAAPGMPPPSGDEDYFDHDRQQGSLPPPAGSRTGSRDAATGSLPRRAAVAKDKSAKDKPSKDVPPMPRSRPEFAKANDPGNAKPKTSSQSQVPAAQPAVVPPQTVAQERPADANAPAKPDVRVNDTPKPQAPASPKPGEAIRY